jgi:3-oxoacyl-[acyl-carrier-protein] synthase II
MTLAVTGWSVLCSAGIGVDAFSAALADDRGGEGHTHDVSALYDGALPLPTAHALPDLDVRKILGRKGTTTLDRRTALALIACRDALRDGRVRIDDETRSRVGVTLGTTWGSLKAMSDYTKETLLEDRPYVVEPARFPNTVMNCAAGQAAIWFHLKGVNATIAGGNLAFLNVLEYTANVLKHGYADTMLAGVVEEFTPHTAWASHLTRDVASRTAAGEAAGVFVVKRAERARDAGRAIDAEVLSVATGFAPGGRSGGRLCDTLERSVRRALARAGVDPAEVSLVATSDDAASGAEDIEGTMLTRVFGDSPPERIAPKRWFGDCQAAIGGLQMGAILVRPHRHAAGGGGVSLVSGWT